MQKLRYICNPHPEIYTGKFLLYGVCALLAGEPLLDVERAEVGFDEVDGQVEVVV